MDKYFLSSLTAEAWGLAVTLQLVTLKVGDDTQFDSGN